MKHGQGVARCLARAISYLISIQSTDGVAISKFNPNQKGNIMSTSTSNQRRRRAQAKRSQRERDVMAAPSTIIPRKGIVRAHGRSFFRAVRDGRFCPGQAFEQDGKTLGVMDANMREHRQPVVHIRPMPNWVSSDAERRWKLQQASK